MPPTAPLPASPRPPSTVEPASCRHTRFQAAWLPTRRLLCLIALGCSAWAAQADPRPAQPPSAMPVGLGVPACDSADWQDPDVRRALAPVLRRATAVQREGIPAFRMDDFLDYSRSGRRDRGERMLAARQSLVAPLVLQACLDGQAESLARAERLLVGLAEQPSWVLPASDPQLLSLKGEHFAELGACELGPELAWSLRLLGERLSPDSRQRIEAALTARLLRPVRSSAEARLQGRGLGAHWWLEGRSNWNAVCVAGAVGTALVGGLDVPAFWIDLAQRSLPHYLQSFAADGYADEGPAYWNYGFGNYLMLREWLREATGKTVDLAAEPQVQRIARYPQRIEMRPGVVAAFGDAPRPTTLSRPLVQHARVLLGEAGPEEWRRVAREGLGGARLHDLLWRLWGDPEPVHSAGRDIGPPEDPGCSHFPQAGVAVFRPAGSRADALAVSWRIGGSQAHAHDDAGSYAIAVGQVIVAGDIGGPTYTRQTFGPERRTLKLVNSWGHPVPLVDGVQQSEARLHRGRWIEAPCLNSASPVARRRGLLDLRPVYDVPALQRLTRELWLDEAGRVQIEDRFEASRPIGFEAALVTRGEVRETEDGLRIDLGGQTLRVSWSGPTGLIVQIERVEDDPNHPFTRIAWRLPEPARTGRIRITATDARGH